MKEQSDENKLSVELWTEKSLVLVCISEQAHCTYLTCLLEKPSHFLDFQKGYRNQSEIIIVKNALFTEPQSSNNNKGYDFSQWENQPLE